MTTTSLPSLQQQSRDEIESSIKEFSRMWPSRTERVYPHSLSRFDDSNSCTIASNDLKYDSAQNHLDRNDALISSDIPLQPLTLETDPNAWDLPTSITENPNRKLNDIMFVVKFYQYYLREGECSVDCIGRCLFGCSDIISCDK